LKKRALKRYKALFNIVLVEPQIPQNTGNIGRLCVATNTTLHIIEPIGFSLDEKSVRRAGLDYWKDLNVKTWKNLEEFWQENPLDENHYFATTKTDQNYFDVKFKENSFLYFGREDKGLDISILQKSLDTAITIPMVGETRSLNLSNSVSIILYEAIKQNFSNFK
jgi:tRNA (cytidine/uridine-2'-O-)-methyltransferase